MIRAANACDISQIAEIEKESFSDGWSADGLAAALEDSIGIFLVSEEQDMIAGYIIGSCDGENGYIEKLAVHPCRRRNGIALKLLEEFAEQQNLSKELMAFVYSEGLSDTIRTEATDMAKKMGFKEILWIQTGGVVTTHCGPGGFGVCGFESTDGNH